MSLIHRSIQSTLMSIDSRVASLVVNQRNFSPHTLKVNKKKYCCFPQ